MLAQRLDVGMDAAGVFKRSVGLDLRALARNLTAVLQTSRTLQERPRAVPARWSVSPAFHTPSASAETAGAAIKRGRRDSTALLARDKTDDCGGARGVFGLKHTQIACGDGAPPSPAFPDPPSTICEQGLRKKPA